ncbi:hypothetical protein BKA66DRAFT_551414 [Pyrenochaeta sp. MPI-SDFR-AT-0127]|nr:hypothetical protein BKA66DRAFT_551414 [Pyrenochaeta sp. MPI-SDFR-AT-0127]
MESQLLLLLLLLLLLPVGVPWADAAGGHNLAPPFCGHDGGNQKRTLGTGPSQGSLSRCNHRSDGPGCIPGFHRFAFTNYCCPSHSHQLSFAPPPWASTAHQKQSRSESRRLALAGFGRGMHTQHKLRRSRCAALSRPSRLHGGVHTRLWANCNARGSPASPSPRPLLIAIWLPLYEVPKNGASNATAGPQLTTAPLETNGRRGGIPASAHWADTGLVEKDHRGCEIPAPLLLDAAKWNLVPHCPRR